MMKVVEKNGIFYRNTIDHSNVLGYKKITAKINVYKTKLLLHIYKSFQTQNRMGFYQKSL